MTIEQDVEDELYDISADGVVALVSIRRIFRKFRLGLAQQLRDAETEIGGKHTWDERTPGERAYDADLVDRIIAELTTQPTVE
jgi:hypothetical protein